MSTQSLYRSIFTVVLLAAFTVLSCGCSSRPAAAQKLFARGDYQKVIDKYPDLEIARRAESKMAEKLLDTKQYYEVIRQYPQTSAAYKAKMALAQQLFDAGKYQAVIDSFAFSPLVAEAKARMADSLILTGQIDELLARYPDSPKAKEIKEQRAQEAFAKAKKLRGDAQRQALEEITRLYNSTSIYKDAMELLSKKQRPPKK
jgi:hypothetical protein